MQIIKDRKLTDNDWSYTEEAGSVGSNGNITFSLECWKDRHLELAARSGKNGIRLMPADDVAALAEFLREIDLVELFFPNFGDGRHFSNARLLRIRLGYQGEIRAVGHFLPDQIYYMQRVGINAFQLEDRHAPTKALTFFNDFSVNYQN